MSGGGRGWPLSDSRQSATATAISAQLELADRLVDVGEQGSDRPSRRRRLLDGIGDERQRATGEGVADELGRDVEDPVAEAVVGPRGAVVRLVGMQDVQLTGQADTARAAVAKGLHAGGRDADRVGVVPVRLERARGEVDLGALDAVRARSEPDRVRPSARRIVQDGRRRRLLASRAWVKGIARRCLRRCCSRRSAGGRSDRSLLISLAIMGSPGPATISLVAAGSVFGVRRSLRVPGRDHRRHDDRPPRGRDRDHGRAPGGPRDRLRPDRDLGGVHPLAGLSHRDRAAALGADRRRGRALVRGRSAPRRRQPEGVGRDRRRLRQRPPRRRRGDGRRRQDRRADRDDHRDLRDVARRRHIARAAAPRPASSARRQRRARRGARGRNRAYGASMRRDLDGSLERRSTNGDRRTAHRL